MKVRIAIVEDDPSIRLGLTTILQEEDFDVVTCDRGDTAVEFIRKEQPHLVILDVMLPGANGFDVCKRLRAAQCRAAILMLTAKSQEIDKVVGLDAGADDYLTKPFGVRELVARIHALLRRAGAPGGNGSGVPEVFRIGGCEVDGRTLQLRRGRTVEELTARELKLLQTMVARPGEVFSRDRLLNEVWGYNYFGTTRTLDQCVVQVRRKLGDSAEAPRHLLTVHGVGYKLVV